MLVYLVYLVCLIDRTGNSFRRTRQTSPSAASTEAPNECTCSCSCHLTFRLLMGGQSCAQHSHPPNPERAQTRSYPRRAHSYRARSASRRTTRLPSRPLSFDFPFSTLLESRHGFLL